MITSVNCLPAQSALLRVGQDVLKKAQLAEAVPTAYRYWLDELREANAALNLPVEQVVYLSLHSVINHLFGILPWLEY